MRPAFIVVVTLTRSLQKKWYSNGYLKTNGIILTVLKEQSLAGAL